tara:strand:- start:725 stop:856 length:132 start_codon:yes stop_codon:yes gene_type:complete
MVMFAVDIKNRPTIRVRTGHGPVKEKPALYRFVAETVRQQKHG